MKKQKILMLVMVMAIIFTTSAGAGVIFTESFEDPVISGNWKISGFGRDGPWPGWIGQGSVGGGKYTGIFNTDINVPADPRFVNSIGDQVAYIFNNLPGEQTNARLTTTTDSLDIAIEANTTYTLKFNTATHKGNPVEYDVRLLAIAGDGTETILASVRGQIASNDFAANPMGLTYSSGDSPDNEGDRIAIQLRKGDGIYQDDVYYDNIILSSDNMNVSPYDGEIVGGGTVDLSWTNMAPIVGDTVWVDVMFGTEPNIELSGYDMEKVLTAGENATSAQATADAGMTYYWQIISYLKGDLVTDPCASDAYSFTTTTDIAPQLVDILTPDMVTWSGEPVSLTSEVDDDGASALTYAWTASPADGVAFSATDVPNPTVTIIKPVGFSVLPVTNFGFEDLRDAKDGNGFVPYPDGDRDYTGQRVYTWMFPNWGYYYNGYCGILNPTTDAYLDEAPEGENVGFVESYSSSSDAYPGPGGGLKINTFSEYKPNTEYTLSVKVGNPLYNDAFPGYRIQLLAGGSVLAQDANSLTVEPGTFVTSEFKHTSGEIVTPDQDLRIRLFTMAGVVGDPDGSKVYEVHFDDVKLLSDGDSTYNITLAVNDEMNPAVEDTIQIDVFDDACLATVAGMGIRGAGDVNGDCDVNTDDLQQMAAMWLNDHNLLDITATPDGDTGNPVDPESEDTMIDTGEDKLAWSGEPVILDGAIINDANTPQWTADQTSLDDGNLTIAITDAGMEDASVVITKTASTGDVTTVTMTLAVSGVEDSMVIDVYDDACAAAVGMDPLVINAADFNSDCKTNLEDVAAMALKWLTRSTITEPGVKP